MKRMSPLNPACASSILLECAILAGAGCRALPTDIVERESEAARRERQSSLEAMREEVQLFEAKADQLRQRLRERHGEDLSPNGNRHVELARERVYPLEQQRKDEIQEMEILRRRSSALQAECHAYADILLEDTFDKPKD